jgi:hypothetical protein
VTFHTVGVVSEADRRLMKTIARSLAEIETDEPATPVGHHDEERPEEEFYRRARALGFRRLRR